jgi:S-formylglutathione hydrolase FrmB
VTGLPRVMLRSEGAALLAMAAVLYGRQGQSWWLFVALLAVPDWGLLGYLAGARAGAIAYDLTHTYPPPRSWLLVVCSAARAWPYRWRSSGSPISGWTGLWDWASGTQTGPDIATSIGDRASRPAGTRRRPPRAHIAVLLAVLLVSVAAYSRSEASDTARRVERAAEVAATETLSRRMRDLVIDSPALDRYAMVRLLLPRRFQAEPGRRWPVLWLLHGCCDTYDSWTRSTDVEELAALDEALVVLPEAGQVGFYSDWRERSRSGPSRWRPFT